jgi:type IV pilus assembly protein PilE
MKPRRKVQQGVTLIELLVVILIIGILAGIAIPSYRQYTIRVRRADAKIALTSSAQFLERCFTRANAYNNPGNIVPGCTLAVPYLTPDGTYNITGNINAATFTLTATPQGPQASDADCANFMLDQTGTQTVSGTKTAIQCWKR